VRRRGPSGKHLRSLRIRHRQEFKDRVHSWAKRVGVQPRRVQIQGMRKKWASCSTTGTLTFSQSLLDQPKGFREYVVAHEVLHLSVPNHGRLFRSLMSAFIPGWEVVAKGRVSGACAARPTRRQI